VNPDKYKHTSDQQLLENFYSDNDPEWLGILLPRYTLLLLGVCMKYLKNEEEAKDCVQQIFLKAITELKKYKIDYFKSWIYMVAKNHCLMKIRDGHGKIPVELTERYLSTTDEQTDTHALLENEQAIELMAEALRDLSPEQQQCVTLFYLKKKSYVQISEVTGFTMMQVKSYIQNGKRNLRIMLAEKLKGRKKSQVNEMSENLKDILSHLSPEIDQETLLLYLQDKLTAEKKHEIEKKLLENEFVNDATEGLQEFRNKDKLTRIVDQLNHNLKNKLQKKKRAKRSIHLKDQPWLYLAVMIIILLIIISYFVIQRLQEKP